MVGAGGIGELEVLLHLDNVVLEIWRLDLGREEV